ncbi:glycoside hydrolase superfamily [Podospora didyma]|uniref:Alpha-galactosidase n=1 Tax=Podospora didyma TaxID=330526 RepID=A0AAE0NG38_9PEZI|nr:glycoside hydrolase superfamily [Podospora didyma]
MFLLALLGSALVGQTAALVSPGGVGRLPAMGWNSWNEYACDIKEEDFVKTAQLMVSLGLKDAGYEYVNIDDCWSDKIIKRDPTTKEIVPDFVKFPQGIKNTVDLIHGFGLKVGLYSDAGTETCAGYAGSLGHEEIDALTFSNWGIDYLKYDNCAVPSPSYDDEYKYIPEDAVETAPPTYDWSTSKTAKRFTAMGDALLKQTRTIQYSLCAWGYAHVEQWGATTGHSWRSWGDIMPLWAGKDRWSWGLMPIVNAASFLWHTTDFWGHNDWDMLEVGNGDLTIEENRSHFALWCAFKSPLIIGTRLDAIKPEILRILSNEELIAFSQDPVHGSSAKPFKWGYNPDGTSDREHPAEYWVGTSVRGIHLFLLNTRETAVNMRVLVGEIPGLREVATADTELVLHDMWTGQDMGRFEGLISVNVARHDTAALRITTTNGTHPTPEWSPKQLDQRISVGVAEPASEGKFLGTMGKFHGGWESALH